MLLMSVLSSRQTSQCFVKSKYLLSQSTYPYPKRWIPSPHMRVCTKPRSPPSIYLNALCFPTHLCCDPPSNQRSSCLPQQFQCPTVSCQLPACSHLVPNGAI